MSADSIQTTRRKRYHGGDYRNLSEISDPRQWSDETRTSVREWASENSLLAFGFLVISLLVVALLFMYAGRFGAQLLSDPKVLVGTAFVAAVVASNYQGRKAQRQTYGQIDWLVLKTPTGVKRYHGYYAESDEGNEALFVPLKGFSRFGSPTDPYTIAEISDELARNYANMGRDPDDAATIRLHPDFVEASRADDGLVVAQLSAGLELDPFGRDSTLEATLPDLAEEEALSDMKDQLESAIREKDKEEQRAEDYRRMYQEARELLEEVQGRAVDDFLNRYQKVREVERSDYDPNESSNGTEPTHTPESQQQRVDVDSVEEELEADDD